MNRPQLYPALKLALVPIIAICGVLGAVPGSITVRDVISAIGAGALALYGLVNETPKIKKGDEETQ